MVLTERKIVIIGGSSGIGAAVTKILSENGADLTITGRNKAKLEKIKAENQNIKSISSFDFTNENLLTNWGQIYTKKKSDIRTIVDLNNKKVSVLQGDIHYSALKKSAFKEAERQAVARVRTIQKNL